MTTKITEKNISNIANAAVQWQSVVVADGSTGTTGVAGRGYFINTTSAAHTFTLPSSATRGDTIAIKDYAGTFATFNLTIARNGHNIQGVANNSLINTNRASVVLVYVDVTRGWEFTTESNVADLQEALFISATGGTITTSGNFKIHTFTGDGCFVVSTVGNPAGGGSNVDYLVVAGGGGGGFGRGAGGGAGGYRTSFPSPGCNAGSFPVTATTFPITVGGGGAGDSNAEGGGTNGSNSVFSTITSAGGGGGATQGGVAGDGGSGGGAQGVAPCAGGAGNTPPVSPPQGNPGGPAGPTPNGSNGASGGGGAGAAGGSRTPTEAGIGGVGSPNIIYDSPTVGTPGPAPGRYYAGGAGAGGTGNLPSQAGGAGGAGGGGDGAPNPGSPTGPGPAGVTGTSNTGGGGGGGAEYPSSGGSSGGSGGKGIVIIRYKFQ